MWEDHQRENVSEEPARDWNFYWAREEFIIESY